MEVDYVLFLIVLFGAVLLYLLPWLIAGQREHPNTTSILLINFFFGWTLLGWVVCLAWAVSNGERQAPRPLASPALLGTALLGTAVPDEKACPYCETMIPNTAKKCRACGEWVVPESERALV